MTKKLVLIFAIILLSILFFSASFLFYIAYFSKGRANVKISVFSPENSYVFFTPLQAKADGKEKIRLTVFLLDDRGLGVANQKVELGIYPGLNIEPVQPITDQTGKAIFDISSQKPGEYYLEIKASGRTLLQKPKLKFLP